MNNPIKSHDISSQIGSDILSLVISGIYSNPLSIYREYLQNAADAIESSTEPKSGEVIIQFDLSQQSVTIRDNGTGLSYAKAKRQLLSISKSTKSRKRDRGFRGIGRLSGLAFGKSVTFLTRYVKNDPITKVIWDGDKLKKGIDQKLSVDEIIQSCVTVEKLNEDNYPDNFFEVKIDGMSRYAASFILNQDMVKHYLGEVCPVPFNEEFPYQIKISNLLKANPLYTLKVYLNENENPVTRLHQNSLSFANDYHDQFSSLEKIKIPALNKNGNAAVGWIAHSSYLGALPKKLGIRCLRARAGNIQIGDETIFDHLFSESRFNRWCVAEIHILDSNIIPNGKRDYFEPNAHLRHLENHLTVICGQWERKCRMASHNRNLQKNFESFLKRLESTYEITAGGYLTKYEAKQLVTNKLSEINDYRKKHSALTAEYTERLKQLEKKLSDFRPPKEKKLTGANSKEEALVYRKIFKILTEKMSSPQQAKEIIEAIVNDNNK